VRDCPGVHDRQPAVSSIGASTLDGESHTNARGEGALGEPVLGSLLEMAQLLAQFAGDDGVGPLLRDVQKRSVVHPSVRDKASKAKDVADMVPLMMEHISPDLPRIFRNAIAASDADDSDAMLKKAEATWKAARAACGQELALDLTSCSQWPTAAAMLRELTPFAKLTLPAETKKRLNKLTAADTRDKAGDEMVGVALAPVAVLARAIRELVLSDNDAAKQVRDPLHCSSAPPICHRWCATCSTSPPSSACAPSRTTRRLGRRGRATSGRAARGTTRRGGASPSPRTGAHRSPSRASRTRRRACP